MQVAFLRPYAYDMDWLSAILKEPPCLNVLSAIFSSALII